MMMMMMMMMMNFRLLRKKLRKTLNLSTQDLFYVKLTGLIYIMKINKNEVAVFTF